VTGPVNIDNFWGNLRESSEAETEVSRDCDCLPMGRGALQSPASPVTHARAFDKSAVTLPQSEEGKPLILLISFSHKGEKECDRWNQRLKPAYMHESRVDYYELADFEGVPSFVMSFILHGMRREIPRDEHSHFVPLYSERQSGKS
jgi:hypothetical protein